MGNLHNLKNNITRYNIQKRSNRLGSTSLAAVGTMSLSGTLGASTHTAYPSKSPSRWERLKLWIMTQRYAFSKRLGMLTKKRLSNSKTRTSC